MSEKLTGRSYKSIPHLYPYLKDNNQDGTLTLGQVEILTKKSRKNDTIFVTEKMDGSNVGVWKKGGKLLFTNRYGYDAKTSRRDFHHDFYDWGLIHYKQFDSLLCDGEHVCGEWLGTSHETLYQSVDPECQFQAFDIKRPNSRESYETFFERCANLRSDR